VASLCASSTPTRTRCCSTDRAIFLQLEPIPEERRRPEEELWAEFDAESPGLLGVLLDAVVQGLRQLSETRLDKLPRMADFALWVTACETALWPTGTFWSAYCGNLDEAVESVIDADPVAAAVRVLMEMRTEWAGTASTLLGALTQAVSERVAKSKSWPDTPRTLTGRLRRAAPFLRKIGIEISLEREGHTRTRTIHITTFPAPEDPRRPANGGHTTTFSGEDWVGNPSSASSASSAHEPNQIPPTTYMIRPCGMKERPLRTEGAAPSPHRPCPSPHRPQPSALTR
jgi:hypothetical protein